MARNRFGGYCYRCGQWGDKGDGHFERTHTTHETWRVQHVDCCLAARKKAAQDRESIIRQERERCEEARNRWPLYVALAEAVRKHHADPDGWTGAEAKYHHENPCAICDALHKIEES